MNYKKEQNILKSSKNAFYISFLYVGLGTIAVLCSYPPYYGDWVLVLLLATFPVSILGFSVMMIGKYYLLAILVQLVMFLFCWFFLKKFLYNRYYRSR